MLAVLAVVTASIIGGIAPVVAKIALQTFTPLQIVFFRFGGAAAILVWIALYQKLSWRVPSRELLKLLLGSLLFAGNIIFFIFGIARTTSVVSQLFYLLTPFIIMIWGRLLFKTKIPGSKAFGALIGLAGALLLVLGSAQSVAFGSIQGNLLVATAVLCWGSYLLYSQKVIGHYSPLQLLTTNSFITTLLTLPIVFNQFMGPAPFLQPISTKAVGAIIFLILISSVSMFFLYQWALQRVSAVTVSTAQYISPLAAAVFGALLLGETVSTQLLLSGTLILVGVYFSMIYSQQTESIRWWWKLLPQFLRPKLTSPGQLP